VLVLAVGDEVFVRQNHSRSPETSYILSSASGHADGPGKRNCQPTGLLRSRRSGARRVRVRAKALRSMLSSWQAQSLLISPALRIGASWT